ncbi:MAG: E3 ubiquitin ligase family protein [Gammaproteobacteria bacterium]|nr:E3 ubiquitin ligase family protein [Gammaproteobacteria bacterium]
MALFESLIPPEWAVGVVEAERIPFWAGTTLLLLVTLVSLYLVFRFHHRMRMISDTPTSKIRSAAQGYVELEGEGLLMKGSDLRSPLSGLPCLWYKYKVEKKVVSYDSKGRRQTRWKTIDSGRSESLFLIRDETGDCVIDPDGAEVKPNSSVTWYSDYAGWRGPLPKSGGLISFGGKEYRLSESRIDIGSDLYLLGRFASVGGLHDLPNSREELRQILVEWKRDPKTLLQRFDRDGDGQIDEKEWQATVKEAKKEVAQLRAEMAAQPLTHMIGKPVNSRRPFIISTISQQDMVKRFGYFVGGSAAAFIICGAAATWLLTVRLGQ